MPLDPAVTPDLVISTYHGGQIAFAVTPKNNGLAIADLATYVQIQWDWWSGSPDRPIAKVLSVKYTGAPPNYITIVTVLTFPSVQVTIPAAISGGVPVGEYFADLILTPTGTSEPVFAGRAIFKHQPSTIGM